MDFYQRGASSRVTRNAVINAHFNLQEAKSQLCTRISELKYKRQRYERLVAQTGRTFGEEPADNELYALKTVLGVLECNVEECRKKVQIQESLLTRAEEADEDEADRVYKEKMLVIHNEQKRRSYQKKKEERRLAKDEEAKRLAKRK